MVADVAWRLQVPEAMHALGGWAQGMTASPPRAASSSAGGHSSAATFVRHTALFPASKRAPEPKYPALG